MRISVFGLGYVGAVSAGCLAQEGHEVIGVDPIPAKVDLIQSSRSPIVEEGIGELIEAAVKSGRLRATVDADEGIRESEVSFICVGTPSERNGSLDLRFVRRVCEQIGASLATKSAPHSVVVRSTVLPGTVRSILVPILEEASGKTAGEDFDVAFNPEFLREGTSVQDFYSPPKTVIGEHSPGAGDKVADLYGNLDAPLVRTDLETAEMVKYVDNAWHALKIGFANEIGNLAKSMRVDSHEVMSLFCLDEKLNISSAYLKPGFAFGGSCLPKDLRALTYHAKSRDVPMPIIESILGSNQMQIDRAFKMIQEAGSRSVGVLGFSFKEGTDDLRESPVIELIERLIGKGYELRLYDRNVNISRLMGANRDFILNHIPHISRLMVETVDDVIAHADTLVVGNRDREFVQVAAQARNGQAIIDLVRLEELRGYERYDGICW